MSTLSPLPEVVVRAVRGALQAGHFFVRPPLALRIEHSPDEERPWEIYRGHLLDGKLARERDRFASWHVFLEPDAAPLLSIRWQASRDVLHVTRNVLLHAFEPYEETPGVILTRPAQKWSEELVGSIELRTNGAESLQRELEALLLLATIGTSRLPITSLESPLPAYSLGTFAYQPGLESSGGSTTGDPLEWLERTLAAGPARSEIGKTLETTLRAIDLADVGKVADRLERTALANPSQADGAEQLLRNVFNGAALSPYTGFADALIALVEALGDRTWFGPKASLATLGYMLRYLARHLTAYDLALFHSFGANYPDALFLDALLKAYLRQIERHAEILTAPDAWLLRRALRQAMLLRRQYEGYRVPDAPTSMGENARVLSAPFVRVPDEQIFEPAKRRRALYADDPTDALLGPAAKQVFAQSIEDLHEPRELRELGLALFLDRPLGLLYEPGEVDRTPLLSYEAYSRFVVRRRLAAIKSFRWIDRAKHDELLAQVNQLVTAGLPAAELGAAERPGVVSLSDAAKAAPDFVLLRTTRGSLDALLAEYDLAPLRVVAPEVCDWLAKDGSVLFVPVGGESAAKGPMLRAYSTDEMQLELGFPQPDDGNYRQRYGVEVPRKLAVLSVRKTSGGDREDLSRADLWLTLAR